MGRLQDKVALVTGSSHGIGSAIARLFASEGAKVVLHGRDKDALQQLRNELSDKGGNVIYLTADVTKYSEIEVMRQRIEKEWGFVDILAVNAGGSHTKPMPFEEIPEDGWHASIDANLTASFLTIKSFLPGMKTRKSGNIITMSSAAARHTSGKSPVPYSAAKAGIQVMTQHLASELGPFGIRVNCIAPETIMTERNKQWITDDMQKTMAEWHPIKRLGMPEDVAQAALFLASEESSWITGVILDVAGGVILV